MIAKTKTSELLRKPISGGLFIFMAIISFSACHPSYRLAGNFVNEHKKAAMLIFEPDYLNLVYSKQVLVDTTADQDLDSLQYFQSDFLQYVNDSLFISNYVNAYASTLQEYGFQIYRQDQVQAFLAIDSLAYVVDIAQLEFEEFIYDLGNELGDDEPRALRDLKLNAVNVNSWFELKNLDAKSKQLLFANHFIYDDVQAAYDFNIFSMGYDLEIEIDSLDMGRIYEFSSWLGSLYATYTFDFLLNNYLSGQLPEDKKSGVYYRYDNYFNILQVTENERFELLETMPLR